MLRCGAARLYSKKKAVNDLNVFPIPDGDTGDNMYMTIEAGCNAISADGTLGETAEKASRGMLLGARGNSGVILSRIFAGLARGTAGTESIGVDGLKKAMQCAVEDAYKAVSTPVEGTILTVLREGVENCRDAASIEDWFTGIIPAMKASLEHTPELLPVLKEAGVVDSGGAGLLCIMQGMKDALEGNVQEYEIPAAKQAKPALNLDDFGPDTPLEFGYCTEFLLRLQHGKVPDIEKFDVSVIRDYLTAVGNSVVCFKDGSIVKAHVHTRTPGEILSHVQTWGEFLTVKIENMTLQHSEADIHDHFDEEEEDDLLTAKKRYAVVTVAAGEGLVQAFRDTGADYVIEGGQTMNPSAQDFIKAFDAVKAETVFVFPNNSNIIMAAQQAAGMYGKSKVLVLPSKTIGAGYVACASLDRSCPDVEEIVKAAIDNMDTVATCQVSRAIRDASQGGVDVKAGDYIAFERGNILCSAPTAEEAALQAVGKMGIDSHDVALVFRGQEASPKEAEALSQALQSAHPRTEIMPSNGGQPVFEYIIVLC